jgi:hypothetical protein
MKAPQFEGGFIDIQIEDGPPSPLHDTSQDTDSSENDAPRVKKTKRNKPGPKNVISLDEEKKQSGSGSDDESDSDSESESESQEVSSEKKETKKQKKVNNGNSNKLLGVSIEPINSSPSSPSTRNTRGSRSSPANPIDKVINSKIDSIEPK